MLGRESSLEHALRFFTDRSLGSKIVPQALRAAGWKIETMDERYGVEPSQLISDVQWIEEATLAGDVLLAKDLRIAKNVLEATAVYQTSARAFVLARRDIDGPTMARYFIDNEPQIMSMARRVAGPYVVAVSREGIHRVPLNNI
jgi:PIN domain-containing protein